MFIYVNLNEVTDCRGEAKYFYPDVRVEHSPREGLNHEVIRKLENELQELVTKRLNEAMRKEGEQ